MFVWQATLSEPRVCPSNEKRWKWNTRRRILLKRQHKVIFNEVKWMLSNHMTRTRSWRSSNNFQKLKKCGIYYMLCFSFLFFFCLMINKLLSIHMIIHKKSECHTVSAVKAERTSTLCLMRPVWPKCQIYQQEIFNTYVLFFVCFLNKRKTN